MSSYLSKCYNELKALYWSNDQDCFSSAPIKMYHGFMIEKMGQTDSKLTKLAWRVAHVVTGIFAYPILGSMAALDMACTLLNARMIKRSNDDEINSLMPIFSSIHEAPVSYFSATSWAPKNSTWKTVRDYYIHFGPENSKNKFKELKQKLAEEMQHVITQFTHAHTRVYIQCYGSWQNGMRFTFIAADSKRPSCSNPLLPHYRGLIIRPSKDR